MNHVTGKENVLNFPERENESKERSICASGFFSISNDLADKLCSTRLSDQEHRVLFAVMRRTIGYGRYTCLKFPDPQLHRFHKDRFIITRHTVGVDLYR